MTWMCADRSCGMPLRQSSVRVADAPGTQQHAADGLCKRCYNKRQRDAEVLTPQQLAAARNALNGYLKARQNRITRRTPCANTNDASRKQPMNSSNKSGQASSTSANYATC